MRVRVLQKVVLYDEGADEGLKIGEIAAYLKEKLKKAPVEVKEICYLLRENVVLEYARKLASIKTVDISKRLTSEQEPLYGEIEFERRRLLGRTRAFGAIYDGFLLQRVFSQLIPRREYGLESVHIFFTNRLFATWEEGDKRYHARTSVYGLPSVISTTGLVEAPAKPKEYYLLKQRYEAMGKDLLELNEIFKGRFIGYSDERLTDVTKGYAMQAVFFSLTGDPFCEDRGCRLYNAHWQEEVISAQLESPYEYCERHKRILEGLWQNEE